MYFHYDHENTAKSIIIHGHRIEWFAYYVVIPRNTDVLFSGMGLTTNKREREREQLIFLGILN